MFSVRQCMEEGFKFIIPPPKYHPFPNILPILTPSFPFEKDMAAENPYHRLPEDNVPRPSLDSVPGDDQRLLDSDPLYDDDSPPPKKGTVGFKLSYHPTFYIRLLVLCLFICAFGIFIAANLPKCTIPTIVFLSCAIFRSITVLYSHLFRRCFIRIHFEIIGRPTSTSNSSPNNFASNSNPKKWRPSLLRKRSVQLIIDWVLIIVLISTSIMAQKEAFGGRYWRYDQRHQRNLVLAGCILCWIALPFNALSTIDMGKPGRIKFSNSASFDMAKEKEDTDEVALPRTYRDVEASGGLHPGLTRKTGADSPPMI